MNKGKWLAVDKELVEALPTDRAYTILEAAFSYQLDMDNGKVKSLRSYSRIWQWSMTRVTNLIRNNKVSSNERRGNTRRTIKFRWINKVGDIEEQRRGKSGPKANQVRDTTNNTNTYPKTNKNYISNNGGKNGRKLHRHERKNNYDRSTEVFKV